MSRHFIPSPALCYSNKQPVLFAVVYVSTTESQREREREREGEREKNKSNVHIQTK